MVLVTGLPSVFLPHNLSVICDWDRSLRVLRIHTIHILVMYIFKAATMPLAFGG
jgi:hypothetical protein